MERQVSIMMGKFNFRGRKITYSYEWLDDDTFVFQFGDGEFQDEDGDYFIHFEYHVKDNEWVVEVFWDGNAAVIRDINNADDYITVDEMEMVMNFAEQFIERQVDIMYKVQYMNYKTKEIAEEEFKHPKNALSRYLTIGESMKENGIDICSLKIFNQKGKDITGKVNHFIIEM